MLRWLLLELCSRCCSDCNLTDCRNGRVRPRSVDEMLTVTGRWQWPVADQRYRFAGCLYVYLSVVLITPIVANKQLVIPLSLAQQHMCLSEDRP